MRLVLSFLSAFLIACVSPRPATDIAETPPARAVVPPAEDLLVAWKTKVTAVKSLEDEAAKRDGILMLIQEALSPREVRVSGEKHAENVHPEDNEPAPIINFDPRLNEKQSAKPSSGGDTRSLKNNSGYYFSYRGQGYVVIGPAALDPRSPVFTKLAAEHELYHATNHVGDGRPLADRELETWTEMFIRYFADIDRFRQRWAPMLEYYEDATAAERETAIARLVTYYRNPPSSPAELRTAIHDWIDRRKKDKAPSQMIADLEQAITQTPGVSP